MAVTRFTLLLLTITVTVTQGAKILVIPTDHHSHVNYFALVGGILKEAGHDVHLLSFPRHEKVVEKSSLTPIIFNTDVYNIMGDEKAFMEMVMNVGQMPTKLFNNVSTSMVELCSELYSDKGFAKRIEEEKFDLAIVDGVDFFRCVYILPYRHDIPYITLTSRHDPWSARVSSVPSGENLTPLVGYEDPYNPTFLERVKNFIACIAVYVMMPPGVMSDDLITKYAPKKPQTTFLDLFQGSEMFMVNLEIYCLDFPRVSAPHYMFLGGVGLKPAKPLNQEFEDFVKDATDGVIIMTFGSALKQIPLDKLEIMIAAYKQVQQKVIMRYDGPMPSEVPTNVKLSKWLPQSDLLGHPKTKLFITHGGNNGQMEALYHSVPMVTIPVFGDQFYNGQRVSSRGFGKVVDYRSMKTEDLLAAIKEVLSNPSYKEGISSCSEKFHAMPNTADTLTYWVDHVVKFGGDHLKPKYIKMPMWKFFGLDILFIVGECLHFSIHGVKFVVVTVIFFILKRVKRLFGSSKPKAE